MPKGSGAKFHTEIFRDPDPLERDRAWGKLTEHC